MHAGGPAAAETALCGGNTLFRTTRAATLHSLREVVQVFLTSANTDAFGPEQRALAQFVSDLQVLAGFLCPSQGRHPAHLLMQALVKLPPLTQPAVRWMVCGLTTEALLRVARCQDKGDLTAPCREIWSARSTDEIRMAVATALVASTRDAATADDPRVAYALAFMEAHLHETSLDLEQVSGAIRISRWHLSRLFMRNTGASFRAWLRRLRVERAASLLQDWKLSVKEVAALAGYSHPSVMDRDFRRLLRLSPSAWRRAFSGGGCAGGSGTAISMARGTHCAR
jgi:AraC-like DNA-binding protein